MVKHCERCGGWFFANRPGIFCPQCSAAKAAKEPTQSEVYEEINRHTNEYKEMMNRYPDSAATLTLSHIETMNRLLAYLKQATS